MARAPFVCMGETESRSRTSLAFSPRSSLFVTWHVCGRRHGHLTAGVPYGMVAFVAGTPRPAGSYGAGTLVRDKGRR